MALKKWTLSVFLISSALSAWAQSYFPPVNTNAWDTISPHSLNWCSTKVDSLYSFLDSNNTKAFILLKDGKIVLEEYFNGHTQSSNWYWASAGKTLTATLVGIAQQKNMLSITDATSYHLGTGWTSCTPASEQNITIRHQLTMTTGLDDAVADPYCTIDSCLQCVAPAGTRWAYHNASYTLLGDVLENATGENLNVFARNEVLNPIGMNGFFVPQGYNKLFLSTARSMARFGLLIQNNGVWNGTPILKDSSYFYDMVNTSQSLNPAYGYLWWLNGKNSYRIPQSQFVFNGSITPSAPADMIAALGKNGQCINVVPSKNLVWIRMGDSPDNSLVSFLLNEAIWKYLNELECSGFARPEFKSKPLEVFPNPVQDFLYVKDLQPGATNTYSLLSRTGSILCKGSFTEKIDLREFPAGIYFIEIEIEIEGVLQRFKVVKV